jgi:hypothetical protein
MSALELSRNNLADRMKAATQLLNRICLMAPERTPNIRENFVYWS